MENKRIAIICAMNTEIEDLISSLDNEKIESAYGYDFHIGKINGVDVVLIKCGVGKVNAARGTQMLIDRYDPAAIINSGIAGGIARGLNIGDIVIGTEFVQHDFDVHLFGYARGNMCSRTAPDEPTVFTADKALVEELTAAAERIACSNEQADQAGGCGRHVLTGRIASGDQFIASVEDKQLISRLFNATAVEMEGAAIAHTAEYSGIPYAVIRVISDLADGTSPESYPDFEVKTAHLSAAIMLEFLAAH